MNILICGATGFIGQALCRHLEAAGHRAVRGVRQPTQPGDIGMDFTTDTTPEVWRERLTGIAVVINAVGILTENRHARFTTVHHQAPAALFAACAEAGVQRVIQISALGAEGDDTPYFSSKLAADRALMALPMEWQILRPALVYGTDGASANMFRTLASLPVMPVPALGAALFQPIHIDDLLAAVECAIDPATPAGQCVNLVGSRAVSFPAMLASYRRSMGLGRAWYPTIPAWLISGLARLAGCFPGSPLTPDTWRMLQAGSAADAAGITHLLGRPPQSIDQFIVSAEAERLRLRAFAAWRNPLLRYALAGVWIATALISVFIYPLSSSLALLAQAGLTGWPAHAALYGAAALDFSLGVACLTHPSHKLWVAQAALIALYSAVIAIALPEFLSHPFGPILKNLPMLAILFILYAEADSWTT